MVRKSRAGYVLLGVLWLGAVGLGMEKLLVHQSTPGLTGVSPVSWPAQSRLKPVPGRPTLVLAAHPKCPCTRASIGELARIMAECQGKVTAYVLSLKPAEAPDKWDKTDLWRSAAAIPGVKVIRDSNGIEAVRFGAMTSGQTLLYDAEGLLRFSGGITGSRGHAGDNSGHSAIVSLVNGGTAGQMRTAVFGCSLRDSRRPD